MGKRLRAPSCQQPITPCQVWDRCPQLLSWKARVQRLVGGLRYEVEAFGALDAGRALFTRAAGPDCLRQVSHCQQGPNGERFCTTQNRNSLLQTTLEAFFTYHIALTPLQLLEDTTKPMCGSPNEEGYRSLVGARDCTLVRSRVSCRVAPAAGHLHYTQADTRVQPAPTRQGTSSIRT